MRNPIVKEKYSCLIHDPKEHNQIAKQCYVKSYTISEVINVSYWLKTTRGRKTGEKRDIENYPVVMSRINLIESCGDKSCGIPIACEFGNILITPISAYYYLESHNAINFYP